MRKRLFMGTTIFICIAIAGGFLIVDAIIDHLYNNMMMSANENISELIADNIEQKFKGVFYEEMQQAENIQDSKAFERWLDSNVDHTANDLIVQILEKNRQRTDKESIRIISLDDGRSIQNNGAVRSEEISKSVWYQKLIKEQQEKYICVLNDDSSLKHLEVLSYYPIGDKDTIYAVIEFRMNLDAILSEIIAYQEEYQLLIYFFDANYNEIVKLGKDEFPKYELIHQLMQKSGLEFRCKNVHYQILSEKNLDCKIVIAKSDYLQVKYHYIFLWKLIFILLCVVIVIIVAIAILHYYHINLVRIENTDELTGLYNRKYFQEVYKSRIKKDSDNYLMILDIDKFKTINDTYGHNIGDKALKLVSDTMTEVIGEKGILCRWGGDEFVGIVCGKSDEIKAYMNQLTSKINSAEFYKDCKITISVGVTRITKKQRLKKIIEKADQGLYHVKEHGRNGIKMIE